MRVEIENFQSIRDLDLEVEGLTVVVGKGNIGKSAIVRAILSALSNPPAETFIHTGEKNLRVAVHFEGMNLEWRKGADGIHYDIDGYSPPKVGRSLPEDIQARLSAHGLRTVRILDKDVFPQFSPQENPVFLLDHHGGVVAEVLSQVSGVDIVAAAIEAARKDQKEAKNKLSHAKKDAKRVEDRLGSLDGLDEILEGTGDLSKQMEEISEASEELSVISGWMSELEVSDRRIGKLQVVVLHRLPPFDLDGLMDELRELEGFIEDLGALDGRIGVLESVQDLELEDPSTLESDMEELRFLQTAIEEWNKSEKAIQKNEWLVEKLEEELAGIQEELDRLVEEAGGVCPICEKPWEGFGGEHE